MNLADPADTPPAVSERIGCDYLPQAPGEFRRILVFATTTFAAAVAAATA
jgi:hypothetical protein